jgi:hypothetical protein
MKVEYGLDKVNNPPVFHFYERVEEKLRNNRWHDGGRPSRFPAPGEIFPELVFAEKWKDFRPSEELLYLDDAQYWWEYAHGLRKPGQYDEPGIEAKAADRFARKVFLGAVAGDAVGPTDPDHWQSVQAWLEKRHPELLQAFERDHARMPVVLEGSGQQDTLRLLPPGVRRVIKGHADRIQAVVEGRILWDQILGCGHFGCVVPIEGTGRVLKVTTDKTEGPVVQAIMNTGLDKKLDGLIEWHDVWQIPDYEGRGARSSAFAIVRDEVVPYQNQDILPSRNHWIEALRDYNDASRRAGQLKKEYLVRKSEEKAEEALEKLFNWSEIYFVAEAIQLLREEGIVLADVHHQNLGSAEKSPEVTWADRVVRPGLLIFDPGHSQAPPTEVRVLP